MTATARHAARTRPAPFDPDLALQTLLDGHAPVPAGRELWELPGRPAPALTHRLDVTVTPGVDLPDAHVTCTAPPGAPCRQTCPGALEGRCDPDRCDDDCDRSIVDAGVCLATSWLDGDDFIAASYMGPPAPFRSGPIAVVHDAGSWAWTYPAGSSNAGVPGAAA